jgi:hypothetical protein
MITTFIWQNLDWLLGYSTTTFQLHKFIHVELDGKMGLNSE